MPKLCELPIAGSLPGASPSSAYVNPLLVRYIRAGAAEQTVVSFDREHSLNIAQPLDHVRAAIEEALKQ
jgi:hypothetical protein